MAEPENATKAPESDMHEVGSTESEAESEDESHHSTTGEHCVTDRPTPAGQSATGEIIKLNGIDAYISKPADYPHTPCRLLLLLTGGTGIKSTNNQIQADRYASEGFLVLMPDMFGGDTAPQAGGMTIADSQPTSLLDQFKLNAVGVVKSFMIDMWLAKITEDKVMPILHKVIEAARDQYPDAVKHGDGIYAVGYCVGGRYILLLAKETQNAGADEETGPVNNGPWIKAGALAHAASVRPDDFEDLKAPLSLVCVENDNLFPEDVRNLGEDKMAQINLDHEVKVYPSVPHGFAVVGQYQDTAIQDAQATAYDQMVAWIKNH